METFEAFQQNKYGLAPAKQHTAPFNIFSFENCADAGTIEYSRRDFFKIALMNGNYIFHYGDKTLEVTGATLLFFNPEIPYTFEHPHSGVTGQFCIFPESFYNGHYRGKLKDFQMFALGGKPAYLLNNEQQEHVTRLFDKMHDEFHSDYALKFDLVLNCITELIHFALKMKPTEKLAQNVDANVRITAVFRELLERQFPFEFNNDRSTLRTANDFAERMSLHVNHLNRALKLTTGKTTTKLISERLIAEAKVLLKHTDWNISEVSYSLGFDEPTHFNHFFKRQTGITPSGFRS